MCECVVNLFWIGLLYLFIFGEGIVFTLNHKHIKSINLIPGYSRKLVKRIQLSVIGYYILQNKTFLLRLSSLIRLIAFSQIYEHISIHDGTKKS